MQEGEPFELSLDAADPGDDTISEWRIYWNWIDETNPGEFEAVDGNLRVASHTYADGDAAGTTHKISVTAIDEDTSFVSNTLAVLVNNVVPSSTLFTNTTQVNEGGSVTLTIGSPQDPGDDTVAEYIVDWGDDSGLETVAAPAADVNGVIPATTVTHTYADDSDVPFDNSTLRTILVTLKDEDGEHSNSQTLDITVNNVAPTLLIEGTARVTEGATYKLTLGAVDDPGDDAVAAYRVIWEAGGTPDDVQPGLVTHTYPTSGPKTITVELIDEDGSHVGATKNLYVNTVPTAADDTANVDEGSSVRINPAANDSDAENELNTASISIVGRVVNGTLVVNANGTVDYTHDGSETTGDSFAYTIRDADRAESNVATVSINVNPINDAPIALDDSANVDEGGSVNVNVVTNDRDAENQLDLSTVTIADAPANGTAVTNTDGTIDYAHDGSETTSDSFTYVIRDADGLLSKRATVGVTVAADNDAPTAADDVGILDEGGSLNIDLAANDADAENQLDLASISIGTAPAHGTLQINNNGTVDYAHDGGETTSDSFTYTIRDLEGVVSNAATVRIAVTPLNDVPVASDDVASVDEGAAVTINLAANDSDAENALDLASISMGDSPTNGSLTINDDGSVVYTHDGSETTSDSFTYTFRDAAGVVSNTATVNLAVTPVNDAPIARDNSVTIDEGATANVGVAGNDSDADDELPFNSISIVEVPANGTVVVKSNGSVTYTHDGGETTSDSFTDTIRDTKGAVSNVATVQITVNPVNDAAVISQGDSLAITMSEGGSPTGFNLTLDAADGENGPLTWSVLSAAVHGTATASGTGNSKAIGYTPDANCFGADSFVVRIDDGNGAVDDITINLTVEAVNDSPIAGDDSASTDRGAPVTIDVLTNDSDVELSSLTPSIVSGPSGGSATVNAGGSITYAPDPAFFGDDSFTYVVNDGEADSNIATVNLTVVGMEPGVTLFDGILRVIGTEGKDRVEVDRRGSRIEVEVRLDGGREEEFSFNLVDVDQIIIVTLGDKDSVDVSRKIEKPVFIDGGTGNDLLIGGAGNDEIIGGPGNDRIDSGDGDDVILDLSGDSSIASGEGNDIVTTGDGNDRIETGRGDDIINAGGGHNQVWSGRGHDQITAGDGSDRIDAGSGDDLLNDRRNGEEVDLL